MRIDSAKWIIPHFSLFDTGGKERYTVENSKKTGLRPQKGRKQAIWKFAGKEKWIC